MQEYVGVKARAWLQQKFNEPNLRTNEGGDKLAVTLTIEDSHTVKVSLDVFQACFIRHI